jgi:hypothetical protein
VTPYLIFLFIVLVVIFGIYAWRQEVKRREALRAWCLTHGWKLSSHSVEGWHVDYSGIRVFSRGHSRSGDNIITGHFRGRPVTLLDYKYTTGSGKNRQVHNYGLTIMGSDFPTIPLQIRREHFFDKVGEFLGGGDIDFESAEFSRKFHVKSADRKWAYDVIHTRTMDYLLTAPDFMVEFGFGEIVILRKGKCDPAQYESQVEMAWQLYDLIPDYVIKQMKGE